MINNNKSIIEGRISAFLIKNSSITNTGMALLTYHDDLFWVSLWWLRLRLKVSGKAEDWAKT